MTIKLFQPAQAPGKPNLSLFCTKTDILMHLSGLPFETVVEGDPRQGPKGKFPFIEDKGKRVGDSTFIELYLRDTYGIDLYADIDPLRVANARILTSAIEEQLYWVAVYSRWQVDENWPVMEDLFFGSMPKEMREKFAPMAREYTKTNLWGHGMGRHSTTEVYALGIRMVDNLSLVLGEQTYFTGDTITPVDASAYGALINFIQNPVPTPLRDQILGHANLCRFLDRMSEQFFPGAERVTGLKKSAA